MNWKSAHGNGDGFDFGVVAEGVFAEFAADAGHFEAAEGGGGVEDVVAVDPDGAGFEFGGDAVGLGDVFGPDGGGEAVHVFVAAGDDFVNVFEFDDGEDGAEDFFLGDFMVVLDVREDGRFDEVAFVADAVAAGDELGAGILAALDVAHDFVELFLTDLRALGGGSVEGIADALFFGAGGQFFDELVVNFAFDEESRAGTATLALIEEEGEESAFDGGVDVGVGEDDVGGLAAELEGDALQVGSGGGLHDDFADFGGAGEGDLVDIHVLGDGGAGGFAVAGDDVEDAFGETGFEGEFTDAESGEGGLLGGFEDDGAAGGEGGSEFPGLHEDGEVPWDDLADDADGFVAGVAEEGAVDGDGFAFDLVRPAGVVAVAVDSEREIGTHGVVERLAIVEGFELGEFFLVLFDEFSEAIEDFATFAGIHLFPRAFFEGVAGSDDGLIDVGLVPFGDVGDDFAGGGVEGFEGFAAGGVLPDAVDQHFGLADFDGEFGLGISA